MAKTFRLTGMLVPSQGRKSSSQGGGVVGGGVVSSVGTPQESASTVINNINNVTNVVGGDYSKITRITITDLLALDPSEVGENDLYIVYASGSDDTGWSEDDFTYDESPYPAESFFQLINGEWTPITDEIDLTKALKFDDLPDTVYMIESLFPQTSFPNIYGREKAGMRLARIGKYQVDEKGNYKPVFETTGTPGGGTSSNWLWTISVPYARSYMQGGVMMYEGGVLSSADYQQLMELTISGGANIFFATYDYTTHAEIKGAINAGKAVILKKGTEMYLLTSAATSTDPAIKERYVFSKVREDQILLATVNNENTWSSTVTSLLKYTDIRTSEGGWGGVSDRDVPSSKLVKETFDALSNDAVKYTAQSLTDAQKTQARQNIGASGVLTFDVTPTANSANPVTSAGIHTSLSGKMDTDASNATNAAVQNLLDTLPYTSNALTGDDTVVMKIDSADAYKEIPITSLADYIAAPVLASPGSGSISDWDGRLVYQSVGSNRTISAILSPIAVNTTKHSVAIGAATASGDYSFASGYNNTASGNYSFAAGQSNTASNGGAACLGGSSNTASGQGAACVGGSSSTASAMYAVASGFYALADHDHMMAVGKYSRGWTASCTAHGISAAGSDYLLFTVGSGAGPNSRKNSFEVWSTDEAYIGDRGVATLYAITIEGNTGDSHPRLTYGTGLRDGGVSWSLDWFFFFMARQLLTTDKNVVANWYAEHAVSVFYHDIDSDVVYSSFSEVGLRLGFHNSGSAWYPQIDFTDKTLFTNKNFKCVVQFTGK